MNIRKFLYLISDFKNLHSFSEKRFIKRITHGDPIHGDASAAEKYLPIGDRSLEAKRAEEERQRIERTKVEDAPAKPLTEKEVLEAKLSDLKEKDLEAILTTGEIKIEVEVEKQVEGKPAEKIKEERIIKLEALQPSDVDKIITACKETPTCFDKVLQNLTKGKFNAGQFSLESRKILISHYKEDQTNLEKLLNAFLVSPASIRLTIEACENNKELLTKVFELIPDKAVISELSTDTIVPLINAGLYKKLIEHLSDYQKAELLSKEINPQIKGWLFTRLFKENKLNQDAKIVNALIAYCIEQNDKLFDEKIVKELESDDSNAIALLDSRTAKILIEKLESDEKYKALLEKIMKKLPKSIEGAVEKVVARERREKETASTQEFFAEFPKKTSFENRIKAAFAGEKVEIGKALVFYVPSVGGIRRGFRITGTFKKEIQKCKSPAEVKKASYEHLLKVITKDGSIRSDKWDLGEKAGESNQSLVLEIERLTALIEKESPTPELSETEEYQVKQSAKRKLVLATLGGKKGDKYEVTEAGEIKLKGDDTQAAFKELQGDMGATQVVTEPEFKAAVEKAPKGEGEGKVIDPGAVIEAPPAKEEKISEFKDELANFPKLKTILEALLREFDAEITINEKTKSLEIKFKKTPDKKDIPSNFPIFNITPSEKGIVLSYENIFVKDTYSFTLDTKTTNAELKTFISQKYSDAMREYETHMAHVDYFFDPERLKGEFQIKDEKIQGFDPEVDNSGREWEKNWEKIKGHEKIEEVFSRSPFQEILNKPPYNGYNKKDKVPAVIRDIVQEGLNSTVTFEDILEITKVLSDKDLQKTVSVIKESVTASKIEEWLGKGKTIENILRKDKQSAFIEIFKLIQLAINAKDTPEDKKAKLREEERKFYNIYLGSAVILETLNGAKLEEPTTAMGPELPAEKEAVSDEGYQYVGHFETAKGETIPVYTDSEGKLYQSVGTGGTVEPLIDATVRMKAEKAPKFQEAQEAAKLNVAKREYVIGLKTRIDKLKFRDKSNQEVNFTTEIKDTKVEISFTDNKDPNFPKFYFEPELKYDNDKGEWVLKDLKLEYKKYFVGDMEQILLGPNPTNKLLSKALQSEYAEIQEDATDYQEFAKIDLTKFEIAGIGKDDRYVITDPKIEELADGNEDTWNNEFDNLSNHGLYTTALTQHFGASSELEVKQIIYRIIQRDLNSRLYFNDILVVTQAYGGKDFDDSWHNAGPDRGQTFEKRFNFLLRLLKGGELKTVNPDGSPDTKALELRDQYLAELRSMYEIYIGGMKLLKTIQTDKYKPAPKELPSQHLKYQIDDLSVTEKTAIHGIYYNFDELIEEKTPERNNGKTQIGISSEAYDKFIDIYRKALGKEGVPDIELFGKDWESSQILRTLLRGYTPEELLTTKGIFGKEPPKDDTTHLILLNFPANFTPENPRVKFLMKKFHEDSLGEKRRWPGDLATPTQEEDHRLKLADTQRGLSTTNIALYKTKIFELLKRVEQRDKDKVMQWIFSDAVSLDKEMTGTADEEYYDAGDIRRFTSPEAMIDHLFAEGKVKIRPFNFETGRYEKEEEISIFKFENGIKKINEEGLIKYFNYLIQEGLRRKTMIGRKQEKKYDFDAMMSSRGVLIGTWGKDSGDVNVLSSDEKVAKEAYEAFKKSGTKADWEKIPGHERINELLAKSPFGLTEEEIPKKMHELLKDTRQRIWMEKVFNLFLKTSLAEYKPINAELTSLDDIDKVEDEYEFIMEKSEELREKIKENEFEGTEAEKLQQKMAAENKLREYGAKYTELMTYVDAGSALLQRTRRLGEKVQTYAGSKLEIPEGKTFLTMEIRDEQIDAMNGGHVSELMKDEAAQLIEHEGIMEKLTLSKLPNIKRIQEMAVDRGYPIEKVGEIEAKVLGAGIMTMQGDQITGGGVAIPIPIGEDFTLILAGTNKGAQLGFHFNVVKTEDYQGALAGGIGVGFDGKGFASLAYINTHEMTKTVDFSWGFGMMMTATGPAAMVGIAFSYNEKRATEVAIAEQHWKDGYDEIEKAKDIREKAKLIRELPEFKQQFENGDLGSQLEDQDVIATYEEWRNINIQQGFKEGAPPTPFTGFGIGLTFPPPGGFVGIKIRLGETVLIKPRIGERERLAKVLSASAIRALIDEKLKQQNPVVTFEEYKSKELYTDSTGRMGVLQDTTGEMKGATTDLGFLNQAFEKAEARMKAEATKVKIGKPGSEQEKAVVELKIEDTDNKDVCIYIDNDCLELAGVILNKDGRIYIPATIDNLIITRETFKYPYRKTSVGNATTDIIIITTNPHFDRNTVIKESKTFLEKRFEGGKPKQWQISNGYNTSGNNQIRALEEYQGEKALEWGHMEYTEKTFGMPVADYKELESTADETTKALGGETRAEIEKMDSRFEPFESTGKPLAEKIYQKLVAAGLKSGGSLAINDTEAIVAKTNEILEKMKPSQPKLNTKEAGQLISLIQHIYFVNLWAKGGEKEVIEAYRQNNKKITQDLAKAFAKRFDQLEITPPAGLSKEAYALVLTQKIQATAEKNFLKTLADLKTKLSKETLTKEDWKEIPISALPAGVIFYSGTTVRTGKRRGQGLLAGGAELFNVPGVPKMGLIGELSETNPMPWSLDSEVKEERDIAKLILETISPRPKIENLDTFYSSLALKLATFEGTGIEIGKENFKKLSEFYKKSEEEQQSILKDPESNKEFHTALKEFVDFANKVRDEMASGSESPQSMTLKNGTKMMFGAKLYSGSYGECGNLSVMAREEFILVNQANIIVASTSKYVHAGSRMRKEVWEIVIGISWEAAPEKEKRTTEEERKPHERPPQQRKPHSTGPQQGDEEIPEGSAAGGTTGGEPPRGGGAHTVRHGSGPSIPKGSAAGGTDPNVPNVPNQPAPQPPPQVPTPQPPVAGPQPAPTGTTTVTTTTATRMTDATQGALTTHPPIIKSLEPKESKEPKKE